MNLATLAAIALQALASAGHHHYVPRHHHVARHHHVTKPATHKVPKVSGPIFAKIKQRGGIQ